jgi:hypothetical protein
MTNKENATMIYKSDERDKATSLRIEMGNPNKDDSSQRIKSSISVWLGR